MPSTSPPTATSRTEQAWRALQRMQSLTQQLSNLASAIAQKPIKVRAAAVDQATMTDGKTLQIAPPIELGLDVQHEFSVCNKHDETGKSCCPACSIHENVLSRIYHEMGHVLGDSFKVNSKGETAMEVAVRESQWLPLINNQVEDARVNALMVSARPGLKRILGQTLQAARASGKSLEERSTADQLTMSYMIDSEEFDSLDPSLLAPEVLALREDPEYMRQVHSWKTLVSSQESLAAARSFMELARRYGFYLDQDDFDKGLNNEGEDGQGDNSQAEGQDQSESEDQSEPTAGNEDGPQDSGDSPNDAESQEAESSSPEDESGDSEGGDQGGDAQNEADGSSSGEPDGSQQDAPDSGSSGAESGNAGGDFDGDVGEAEADSGTDDQDQDSGHDEEPASDERDDSAGGSSDGSSEDVTEGQEAGDSGEPSGDSSQGSGSLAASSTGTGDVDGAPAEHDTGTGPDAPTGPPSTPEGGATDPTPATQDNQAGSDPVEPGQTWEEWLDKHGTPEELKSFGESLTGHEDHDGYDTNEEILNKDAIQRAMQQFDVFDGPSEAIASLYARGHVNGDWTRSGMPAGDYKMLNDFEAALPSLGEITRNAQRMRFVFAENDRTGREAHLKRGKVNSRVLGKRAPLGDERLFYKKSTPHRRDYEVFIGVDISGSTKRGTLLRDEKVAVWMQMKLLDRLGIPFSVYGHTSVGTSNGYSYATHQGIWVVKTSSQRLEDSVKIALATLPGTGGNLDGHAMQYIRKQAQESTATDRLIMYFSDGAMLNNNSAEERAIMEKELEICRQDKIGLAAVGVGNDDPARWGFPMVRYDSVADIPAVVKHIANRLNTR